MQDGMVGIALLLIAYCVIRLLSLYMKGKAQSEQGAPSVAHPIDRSACQFCELPLGWHQRFFGILHCSADCRDAERFKLGKAVDGVSGGPLYL